MKVELKNLHTILLFIGISGSGKSTKAKQLVEMAKNNGLSSVILSSDDCRHELLLTDRYHHHDPEMGHVSDKAFELLMKKMELYLEWPHNANLIILDAMHLYKEDRQKIIDLANEYCYDLIGIVMDYSNVEEYFLGLDEKYDRRLISRQLRKFHTETMPELGKKLYDDMIRVKTKTEPIELECAFNLNIEDVILPGDKHYFIVSDIHECLESFKALLKKVGFDIEKVVENGREKEKITGRDDTRIIINGDLLDKGNKTRETIQFLYDNIGRILFIKGGHESFVNRWLNGQINSKNVNRAFYTSIPVLEKDEELRQKFFTIYSKMRPFLVGRHFIVTHVGCESRFLGKTQECATRAMRYYHVDRFDDDIDDDIWLSNRREGLKHLKEDAETCRPFHIFGHESWKNVLIYKNKIGIDTGCVSGGKLTGIEIDRWTGRYKLYHVDNLDGASVNEKLREFTIEEPKIELEDRDYNNLLRYARNKTNFISGTMCPADKNGSELEDIKLGLDYYRRKGIDKVMLQIKYMGSRCNIYLFDEIEKSYAVSRNGFLIRLDLTNIYKKLKERLSNYFKENDLEMMIIDGELMPWSALGDSLIDSTFQAINKGIGSELDLLKNNGFEEQLDGLIKKYKESQFDFDRYNSKKEELYKKYGPQKYEAYKLLSNFYMPNLEELEILHSLYNRQLEIYAKSYNQDELKHELHFDAFSILKSVKKNGEEIYYFDSDNETLFRMVSDKEYVICDLSHGSEYEKAISFFDRVTKELNLEGIVIKPLKVDPGNCVPFIKVRSPNYLTIIYGYDYLNKVKYEKLLESKHINKKMGKSLSEWRLGRKLLQIPYKDISENNSRYMDLMTKMIIETNDEKYIDPRL